MLALAFIIHIYLGGKSQRNPIRFLALYCLDLLSSSTPSLVETAYNKTSQFPSLSFIMAAQHQQNARPDISSTQTEVPGETQELGEHSFGLPKNGNNEKQKENIDNLEYPKPWKFENWFIGGYTQIRMLKFKKPKTMYTAINLFAGEIFLDA